MPAQPVPQTDHERIVTTLDRARLESMRARILGWYAENARDLPWRQTTDPYAILVSEIMLQQTQVARVVPHFAAWLAAFPDLEALARAALDKVLREWQGLGYNNRARRLRDCARAAVAAGAAGRPAALPSSLEGLRRLPGIGPYTARAVLIFAGNADLAAVDANVRRVLTHELSLPADLRERHLQMIADAALPHGNSRDWHNALMDYGALVLTARATGIAPRTGQTRFEGSQRQRRARVLRALVENGPRSLDALASGLGLPADQVAAAVKLLRRDGMVIDDGRYVRVT